MATMKVRVCREQLRAGRQARGGRRARAADMTRVGVRDVVPDHRVKTAVVFGLPAYATLFEKARR